MLIYIQVGCSNQPPQIAHMKTCFRFVLLALISLFALTSCGVGGPGGHTGGAGLIVNILPDARPYRPGAGVDLGRGYDCWGDPCMAPRRQGGGYQVRRQMPPQRYASQGRYSRNRNVPPPGSKMIRPDQRRFDAQRASDQGFSYAVGDKVDSQPAWTN